MRSRATLLWMATAILLSTPCAWAAETASFGSTIDGLRIGLSVSPERSVLPTDVLVKVTIQNTSGKPKTIPLSTCHSISWASYSRLMVRVDGGKTYRLRLHGMIDTADLHPHAPLNLKPTEALEAQATLSELAESSPYEDEDMGLPARLLSAKQVELWADLSAERSEGKAIPKLTSGHVTRTFGLNPIRPPLVPSCIAQLVTNDRIACALNRAGTPYCWGDTAPGFDPDSKRHEVSIPRAIQRLRKGVRSIAFGNSELCALTTEGVFCVRGGGDSESVNRLTTPYRIEGLPQNLLRLWTGSADLCAQTDSGEVFCWGRTHLSAAPGTTLHEWRAKKLPELGQDVNHIVIGAEHACARKRDGSVWCWGGNSAGQLGNGTLISTETPTQVTGLQGLVQDVAAGRFFTCGVRLDGQVLCWGKSPYGALGKDVQTTFQNPFVRKDLGSENTFLFAANDELCAQRRDGKLVCMGVIGLAEQRLTANVPILVDNIPTELATVSIGGRDTCTLSKGGLVHCFGETPRAMKLPDEPNPPEGAQPIIGLSDVTSVRVGNSFFCAVSRLGKVSCWGDGSGGQLGAGKLTIAKRPVTVSIPCDE